MHGDAVKARPAPGRECQRSLATCQAMHGDAVKARPGREKTKMVAAQGSTSSVSTLSIRFLPLVFFFIIILLLYSFHPIAEITLKNANIKDEFKGASTRIN